MGLIKSEWNRLHLIYSTKEEVYELADYHRVKRWTKKVRARYRAFTVIAVLLTIMIAAMGAGLSALIGGSGISPLLAIPLFLLYLVVDLLASWGMATMSLQWKQVIKDVGKTASVGYQTGEQFKETHYQVTHEFGDNYRVTKQTEDKGCLFGIIAGFLRFFIWAFFCVYVGTFLTFRKYRAEMDILKQYEAMHG